MKKKKLIYLVVAMMVVLALVGCGDKKKSDKDTTGKNTKKSQYEGMTIKQLLEEEKLEISGAGIFNGTYSVDFSDGDLLYLYGEINLSDEQKSKFENELDHKTYKSYISNNLLDCKISNCIEQYMISNKKDLNSLAEKGKAEKREEMTGRSLLDLAKDGYTYDSDVGSGDEYIITLSDKNNNEWYIVTDVTSTEFEGGRSRAWKDRWGDDDDDENEGETFTDENGYKWTVRDHEEEKSYELDEDVFSEKDERLKDVKVQEAYIIK